MEKVFFTLIVFISIQVSSQTITSTIAYQGYDESQAYYGEGEYQLFLDAIDGVLDKPIIMIDGFDPGDERDISMLYAKLDFNNVTTQTLRRNRRSLMNINKDNTPSCSSVSGSYRLNMENKTAKEI